MFGFIKDNLSTVTTMIVNQVGMVIFALVLSMATHSNGTLFLLSSIFSVCFYMFLQYTVCWDVGAKDKIRLDAGRIPYTPFKGLYISAVANVLNFLFSFLSALGYTFMSQADKLNNIAETSPKWASDMFGVFNAIARVCQCMYIGIIQSVAPNNPYFLLILVVPALFASFSGYFIAIKGKSISGFFGIKRSSNKRA